jgi:hypothetical protein
MVGFETSDGFACNSLIWVDYLCIDQEDVVERNHQVNLMCRIYGKAKTVLVWLGPETDGSDVGIKFLGQHWRHIVHGIGLDPAGGDKAVELLYRDYWRRMWVVQEFFLAQSLLLFAGRESFSLSRDDNTPGKKHLRYSHRNLLAAEPMGYSFLERLSDGWLQKPQPEHMSSFFAAWRHQSCHDPRDRIFGLLGLTKRNKVWPKVDYSMSLEELFDEVIDKSVAAELTAIEFEAEKLPTLGDALFNVARLLRFKREDQIVIRAKIRLCDAYDVAESAVQKYLDLLPSCYGL